MNSKLKRKALEERIRSLEDNLIKAREYLQNGSHANWHGFQPFLRKKIRNGKSAPPHPQWVKNVFIPSCEKAIRKAEKTLDRLE